MPKKGYKQNKIHRDKISKTMQGKMPKYIPDNNGIKRTLEQRKKYSEVFKKDFASGKRITWNKGKVGVQKCSKETRIKMSNSKKGKKSHFWKGGINPLIIKIRRCFEYRQWRSDVFTRDNFTCQECNQKGLYLEAHHIKSFSKIIEENNIKTFEEALNCEELWNINNGLTLCKDCHNKTKLKK